MVYPGWQYTKTSSEFPIAHGETISVSCFKGFDFSGSTEVSCLSGVLFQSDERPQCTVTNCEYSYTLCELKVSLQVDKNIL